MVEKAYEIYYLHRGGSGLVQLEIPLTRTVHQTLKKEIRVTLAECNSRHHMKDQLVGLVYLCREGHDSVSRLLVARFHDTGTYCDIQPIDVFDIPKYEALYA